MYCLLISSLLLIWAPFASMRTDFLILIFLKFLSLVSIMTVVVLSDIFLSMWWLACLDVLWCGCLTDSCYPHITCSISYVVFKTAFSLWHKSVSRMRHLARMLWLLLFRCFFSSCLLRQGANWVVLSNISLLMDIRMSLVNIPIDFANNKLF